MATGRKDIGLTEGYVVDLWSEKTMLASIFSPNFLPPNQKNNMSSFCNLQNINATFIHQFTAMFLTVNDECSSIGIKNQTRHWSCLLCYRQITRRLNPNPIGGGAFMAPPVHFFRRASRPIGISRSNFMTFFSQVSRIFWYIIHPGRTCRTDVRGR